MIVKQLSIFIENKAGSVGYITNLLGSNNINIRSLQIADSTDFGILRLNLSTTPIFSAVSAKYKA